MPFLFGPGACINSSAILIVHNMHTALLLFPAD